LTSHQRPVEVLLSVSRAAPRTLGRQIEDQLREQIRGRVLRPGTRMPSTRDLASELGVSRPIVVEAYAQLAAEGYIVLRQGARPHVADAARLVRPATAAPLRTASRATPAQEPVYDFCASDPDLGSFPRATWLRSLREALGTMPDVALGYGDRHGSEVLRVALSDYLGRVRGVVSEPGRVLVTSGWAQGRRIICSALALSGAKRLAVEDPCFVDARETAGRMGLELVPIPVDADGIQVDALDRANVDAVMVTPAHQFPTGAVLSGERRAALLEWLRRRDAIAIEDDYDAEFRYDRAPVGALQALDPGRIVYAGTASKTLAPALRLGWLVVPPRLLHRAMREQALTDIGCPRIEQHAFADFLARGELDRHLRRMRARYRARRDALVSAIAEFMPESQVCGIAAGLHAAIELPSHFNERKVVAEAAKRGVAVTAMGEYAISARRTAPTLLLGYARYPEDVVRSGVRELAKAMKASR
jgi:GntR family transcriptional regulator/MocR family aminotransferase